MADQARETVVPPFTTFNFRVELEVPGLTAAVCSAAFAECDGLEITLEPKTIREGGNNNRPIHLIGPVSYGQLTLKRGMTDTLDLWDWFERVIQRGQGGLRAFGEVVMLAANRNTEQVRFRLDGCLPVKLKAPALNAQDGLVAIEEMQIAYEMMSIKRPGT
jgi:phage tail-like protein